MRDLFSLRWVRAVVASIPVIVLAVIFWQWTWVFWVTIAGILLFPVTIWIIAAVILWVRDNEWWGFRAWWKAYGP